MPNGNSDQDRAPVRRGVSPEVKVGIFALFALTILAVATIRLGDFNFWKRYSLYKARLAFLSGLEEGSSVRLAGNKVGTIENFRQLTVEERKEDTEHVVELTISIREDITFREGCIGFVNQLSLMGDIYLEITPGDPEGDVIPPDGMIPTRESGKFQDLLDQGQTGLVKITESWDESVAPALENLRDFAAELRDFISRNRQHFDQTSQNAAEVSKHLVEAVEKLSKILDQVDETIGTNTGQIDTAATNIAELTGELRDNLREVSADVRETTSSIRALVKDNEGNLDRIVDNLERFSEDLTMQMSRVEDITEETQDVVSTVGEIMDKINAGTGTVGMLINDPELQGNVSALMKDGRELAEQGKKVLSKGGDLVEKGSRVLGSLSIRGDAYHMWELGRWRTDWGLQLEPTENTLLYAGAADIGEDTRLDLLLGYQWKYLAAMYGVIESDPALAVECRLLDRDLRFRVQGTHLTETRPRLDLSARLYVKWGLGVYGGVYGATDDDPAAFLGGSICYP